MEGGMRTGSKPESAVPNAGSRGVSAQASVYEQSLLLCWVQFQTDSKPRILMISRFFVFRAHQIIQELAICWCHLFRSRTSWLQQFETATFKLIQILWVPRFQYILRLSITFLFKRTHTNFYACQTRERTFRHKHKIVCQCYAVVKRLWQDERRRRGNKKDQRSVGSFQN